MDASRSSIDRKQGFTVPELVVAILILGVVLVPIGDVFLKSSQAFSSLAKRSYTAARAPLVLDRILDEMLLGRFLSLDLADTTGSSRIRFEKIVSLDPLIFSNPIQIDLVPDESSITDGADNDGDGLVDEGAIRIWEDLPPHSSTPGSGDSPTVIGTNVAKDGLRFTREGAVILVEITFEEIVDRGKPPVSFTLKSGVMMRNTAP